MDRLNDRRFDWKEDAPGLMDLGGATCTIDYEDAEGEASTRRITMLELIEGPRGLIVKAYCHEQRSIRHFRVDRIDGIVDEESGEVTPFEDYFRQQFKIALPVPSAPAQKARAPRKRSASQDSAPAMNSPGIVTREIDISGIMRDKLNASIRAEAARQQAAKAKSETAQNVFLILTVLIALAAWGLSAVPGSPPDGMNQITLIALTFMAIWLPVSAIYWVVVFMMRGVRAVSRKVKGTK